MLVIITNIKISNNNYDKRDLIHKEIPPIQTMCDALVCVSKKELLLNKLLLNNIQ